MRKMLNKLICVVGLFVILVLLSYVTTVHSGEEDWSPASLQIQVLDTEGLPVEGATLSVFRANKPVPEFQQSHCYSSNWTSNKDGTIDVLVKPLRYEVTSWWLFWHHPVRQSNANFEARFNAPGFETARVPLHTLLVDVAVFKGRRSVDEAEFEKGFALEEFDVLHATVILKR
jgi:hypothetical protein